MQEAEFVSLVAHELKTPIAVITGLADTLSDRRQALTDAQIDHCLDRISRQGDRLARLVADLLDLSQVESGAFRVSLEPVDLAIAAERALDDTPPPPGKSVELDIPHSLWAVADPERLEQVLVNLLTNAYSYGGSTIRLEACRRARRSCGDDRRRRRRCSERAGSEVVRAFHPGGERRRRRGLRSRALHSAGARGELRGSHVVRARPARCALSLSPARHRRTSLSYIIRRSLPGRVRRALHPSTPVSPSSLSITWKPFSSISNWYTPFA